MLLEGEWKEIWVTFTRNLDLNGIRLTSEPDLILWDYNKYDGAISADSTYDCIVHSFNPALGSRLYNTLWIDHLPRKIGCFSWLVLRNKILTWDNLQKRGKHGPGICLLCNSNDETVDHLFSCCPVWKSVLGLLCDQMQLKIPPEDVPISEFFEYWASIYHCSSIHYYIPHHMIWIIWKARNRAVFDGYKVTVLGVFHQILSAIHLCPTRLVNKNKGNKSAR